MFETDRSNVGIEEAGSVICNGEESFSFRPRLERKTFDRVDRVKRRKGE
jgi:hypothetical protein